MNPLCDKDYEWQCVHVTTFSAVKAGVQPTGLHLGAHVHQLIDTIEPTHTYKTQPAISLPRPVAPGYVSMIRPPEKKTSQLVGMCNRTGFVSERVAVYAEVLAFMYANLSNSNLQDIYI